MLSSWKEKAADYFKDGLSVTDISVLLGISRQSVSAYLKTLPDYQKILAGRQADREKNRRLYKTQKQRQYRERDGYTMKVTGDTLQREHELAVMELSHERYH